MIQTKLSWDNIRQHFSYMWWAYVLMAGLLIFTFSMWYQFTEYDPPADKKLQVTFAGDFISVSVTDHYKEQIMQEFPELEKVMVDNIPLDFTGEGDFAGYQKLQVIISVGEGDIYIMDRELMRMYSDIGAFAPLDALVAEGGALHGMFTDDELAKGTFAISEGGDGEPHLYAIPIDRLYGLLNQGVDTTDKYIVVTSYTQNPVYSEKALVWFCGQTQEEPPAWLEELKDFENQDKQNETALPEIG